MLFLHFNTFVFVNLINQQYLHFCTRGTPLQSLHVMNCPISGLEIQISVTIATDDPFTCPLALPSGICTILWFTHQTFPFASDAFCFVYIT